MLTDEEHEVLVNSSSTHNEQILMLLSFIEKKDKMVFHSFLQVLKDEKKHPGHRELVEVLSKVKGIQH